MRVTVGIPTYNRSELLRGAIESVLGQTFTSFRLLVSDNASEDDTPEVVRSFGDERIEYVRTNHNIGPTGNFRRVIALAETEFLLILPDDDVLYPDHLHVTVDVLDRVASAGLVHTAFDLLDERSCVTGSHFPLKSRSAVTVEKRDLALERLMVTDFPICFSSVLYRTKAILAAGGLREEEGPFGDIQMWMRIAVNWDFGYAAKPLAGFRLHENTTTSNIVTEHGVTSEPERDVLYARMRFERRTDFLHDAPLEPRTAKRLRALATLNFLAARASRGLPWGEAIAGQAKLLWAYPRIIQRPAFWRLLIAQLGGRRVRSALRKASSRRGGGSHK
jgi:glycosyltransferase involved in cell wall biosynthesis